MATAATGWKCTHTAEIISQTETTAKIKVTCYWKNDGWTYNINGVSAWVYCGGSSYKVKDYSWVDCKSSTSASLALGSYTFTVNKTTAAQSISCYAKITSESSYASGTRSSTAANVSVSAKTSYKVKYNANGGSGAPSEQTKWHGTSLTLSKTKPTRTGYSFQGWATSASGSVAYSSGASYTANAAVTLYAVWKANTYTVTYNANGGTGAPAKQTKTYGKTLTLSTVKPTRTNYNFKGWATSATATTATYAAGGSYTANSAATLYAVWELAYTKPRISGLVISRCNSAGETSDEGTYAVVGFSWASDLAVSSIKIEWKPASSSKYNSADSVTVSASGKSGAVNKVVGAGAIDTEKTYTFLITVADSTDDLHTTKKTSNLSGSVFHIDCKPPIAEGEVGGVSVGKPAELDGVFDVGFETRFRDSVAFDSPAAARASLKAWCYDDTVTDEATGSKYVGMARPDGTATGWTRVTQSGLLPYASGGQSSSIGTATWQFKNGHFKNLYADGNDILNGSGWKTATLTSDFVKYDGKDDNMPQYIKIGKLVQVRGAVSPTAAITGSADAYTIFTLPEGYRPAKQVSILSPGSGANQWLLTITASGLVRFARYNNGAGYVNASTSAWLPFHAMYFVD